MVRIEADREQKRTAWVSLASAIGAGLLALLAWAYLREPLSPVAEQRGLADYDLQWICQENPEHRFVDKGRIEPRKCPVCGGDAFIHLEYVCPLDGTRFEVFVQFRNPGEGSDAAGYPPQEVVAKYRYDVDMPWRESDGSVPCPVPGCNGRGRRPESPWTPKPTGR